LRLFLVIAFSFLSLTAFSQRVRVRNIPEHDFKAIHFGFTLGLNTMDFKIKSSQYAVDNDFYGEVSRLSPGFNINIVSNFRLDRHFDLRLLPGVAFGQRKIDYYTMDGRPLPGSGEGDDGSAPRLAGSQNMESSFIEFPVIIKYKSVRIDNYRPYLIGGLNFRYDLARNFSEEDEIFLRLRPFDIYLETGFGIDFYLPYFKFSTELKYAMGFLNMVDYQPNSQPRYQNALGKLNSHLVILSFHFE